MSNELKFELAIENLSEIEVDAGIARRLRADLDLVDSTDDNLLRAIERVARFLEVSSITDSVCHGA